MRNIIRKLARRTSIWALSCTNTWVVDPEIYSMMDCGRLDMAAQELCKQEQIWPDDPELVYAKSLLRFLREELHDSS
jgi:hypothetical protein